MNGDTVEQLIETLKTFANEVYVDLGSGHIESIYEQAILVCLREKGIRYENQKVVEVTFRGHYVGEAYADIFVRCQSGAALVVEIKAQRKNWANLRRHNLGNT